MPTGTRVASQYYIAHPDMIFEWALSDNDLFDREKDLYRLAYALENHDHDVNKGLPVARVSDSAVKPTSYGIKSIPEYAYQDLSVATRSLAEGAVTDSKLAVPKLNQNGSNNMTNDLRISRSYAPTQGALYFGNGSNSIGFNGSRFDYINSVVGGGHAFQGAFVSVAGECYVSRPAAPSTGYITFGYAAFGYNGTEFLANGQPIALKSQVPAVQDVVNVPLGSCLVFPQAATLTAAGARFAQVTEWNGRLLVGVGSGGHGATFVEATYYGANWTPTAGMTVSYTAPTVSAINLTAAAVPASADAPFLASPTGGTTNVSTAPHTHPAHAVTGTITLTGGSGTLNGGGGTWFPPIAAVLWGRRMS